MAASLKETARVLLPALDVCPYRVSHVEFGLKDHHSPLADAIGEMAPAFLRARVRAIAQNLLARFDPKLSIELTASGDVRALELILLGAHPHGFRAMSATLFDIGVQLAVHPVVEQGDYRVVPCVHADGTSDTLACRDFYIRFDVEVGVNPGIVTRLVPVRLQLPVHGPCGSAPPS